MVLPQYDNRNNPTNSPSIRFPFGGIFQILVSVTVFLLLGGLGTLGLINMREGANRAKSQNNMRQIGLGIDSYYDGNLERFPCICDFGPTSPTNTGLRSLHFLILPFVEGGSVLHGYESTEEYFKTPNRQDGPAGWTIETYLSPFETSAKATVATHHVRVQGPEGRPRFESKFEGDYATTNYVANGMVFSIQPDEKPSSRKSISDGLSTTIMLAERYQVCAGVPTLWGMGAYSATAASFALPTPQGVYPKTTDPNFDLKQYVPPMPAAPAGSCPPGFQVMPKPGECDASIMQAWSPKGMIVCLFDGSARVIQGSINPQTFWALVTPAGNEELGADW
jgi:hypothetical protein